MIQASQYLKTKNIKKMDYFKPFIMDVTEQKLRISKLENLGYTVI